ncbi:class I SAM-dependent methyltransferase [Corynebacterium cystitidis]|uniref:class I SAM-dependent methyltransferase n=1 Tax=Corynebacterium cystitidis TaxID=35757 RepID=UPI00211E9391|nr:class I SAM-dependent methyltransferase [Corynebacterium cystitidis]
MTHSKFMATYFDSRAQEWDRQQQADPMNRVKALSVAWLAGVGPSSSVLDVGCGTGVMVPGYLELGASRVVAIDVSPRMIQLACDRYGDEKRVEFHALDILDYEADDPFDAVVIYNAYPHFLDKARLVEKVASVLRPQGRVTVVHSLSREEINSHHGVVPEEVTTGLAPVAESAQVWRSHFVIDAMADTDHYFFFSGTLR